MKKKGDNESLLLDDSTDYKKKLPEPLWKKIFDYLDYPSVIAGEQSCRFFSKISKTSNWSNRVKKNFPLEFKDYHLNFPYDTQENTSTYWYDAHRKCYKTYCANHVQNLFLILKEGNFFKFEKYVKKNGIKETLHSIFNEKFNEIPLINLFVLLNNDRISNFICENFYSVKLNNSYLKKEQLFVAINLGFPIEKITDIIEECDLDILLGKDAHNILYSPFYAAVRMNRKDVIEKLLDKLENTNESWRENRGKIISEIIQPDHISLLHIAAQYNRSEIALFLIENGMKIDSVICNSEHSKYMFDGYTPLLIAVQEGNVEVFNVLMEKKADSLFINEKANAPFNPLLLSLTTGVRVMMESLWQPTLNHLFPAENEQKEIGDFIDHLLKFAVADSRVTHFESVKFLIGKGAKVNQQILWNEKSSSLLAKILCSEEEDRLKMAMLLLEKGAYFMPTDPSIPDRILFEAIQNNQITLVKALIEHDSSLLHKVSMTKQYSPLVWAGLFHHQSIINYLIAKGADVNHQDRDGKNILLLLLEGLRPGLSFIRESIVQTMTLFLERGANPERADNMGVTARDFSEKYGDISIRNTLLSFCSGSHTSVREETKSFRTYSAPNIN